MGNDFICSLGIYKSGCVHIGVDTVSNAVYVLLMSICKSRYGFYCIQLIIILKLKHNSKFTLLCDYNSLQLYSMRFYLMKAGVLVR